MLNQAIDKISHHHEDDAPNLIRYLLKAHCQ